MEIQKDFKEFFALFNAHKVEYVVVGGYALAFHEPPEEPEIWPRSKRSKDRPTEFPHLNIPI